MLSKRSLLYPDLSNDNNNVKTPKKLSNKGVKRKEQLFESPKDLVRPKLDSNKVNGTIGCLPLEAYSHSSLDSNCSHIGDHFRTNDLVLGSVN